MATDRTKSSFSLRRVGELLGAMLFGIAAYLPYRALLSITDNRLVTWSLVLLYGAFLLTVAFVAKPIYLPAYVRTTAAESEVDSALTTIAQSVGVNVRRVRVGAHPKKDVWTEVVGSRLTGRDLFVSESIVDEFSESERDAIVAVAAALYAERYRMYRLFGYLSVVMSWAAGRLLLVDFAGVIESAAVALFGTKIVLLVVLIAPEVIAALILALVSDRVREVMFRADGLAAEHTNPEQVAEVVAKTAKRNGTSLDWGHIRSILLMKPSIEKRANRLRESEV